VDAERGLSRLAALPDSCGRLALRLLSHRSVQRLGKIRQLGFASVRQQTRLQHTLASVELIAGVLAKAPNVSEDLRDHVIAAIALEDIGRAPFSNSLDAVFTGLPTKHGGGTSVDVERSVLVIDYLEQSERILSENGLSLDVICRLLRGNIPWRKGGWLRPFLNGSLDIDRLAYVSADLAYADGQVYDIGTLVKGIAVVGDRPVSVVDSSSIEAAVDFLLQRGRLYQRVYYEPVKLALEQAVGLFLKKLWKFAETADDQWNDVREPKSVEQFLSWTDDTVINAFKGQRWDYAPADLMRLRTAIHEGYLQVAEVRQLRSEVVDLATIQALLAPLRQVFKHEHCWILNSEELPALKIYESDSILVQHHGTVQSLEDYNDDFRLLLNRRHRCPLLIFPTAEFGAVQSLLKEAELVLSNVVQLNRLTP
jgi:HD superfamily phosphohydrolase